jgi:hypothetical protein
LLPSEELSTSCIVTTRSSNPWDRNRYWTKKTGSGLLYSFFLTGCDDREVCASSRLQDLAYLEAGKSIIVKHPGLGDVPLSKLFAESSLEVEMAPGRPHMPKYAGPIRCIHGMNVCPPV